jgi:phosphohistidine phosphatase
MTTLWLLRHAKSSWEDDRLDDHDRPLAPRGERAAAALRDHLAGGDVRPSLVLSSSALRARATMAAILPALGTDLVVRVDPALYTFDAGDVIARLRALGQSEDDVMVVGHEPAMSTLALTLAGKGERLEEVRRKFPTCALATITFPNRPWEGLVAGSGLLTSFLMPRELEGR